MLLKGTGLLVVSYFDAKILASLIGSIEGIAEAIKPASANRKDTTLFLL